MPELLMIRHAKSDWSSGAADDRSRPLSRRGRNAALVMGTALRRARRIPDLVLTSPARRALSTAELAAEAGAWDAPIHEIEELYGSGPGPVIEVLRRVEGVERVALVGHEPTWSAVVSVLIGGGSVRMPTGAVAAVEVPGWAGIQPGSGRMVWLLIPRLFTEGDFDLSGSA